MGDLELALEEDRLSIYEVETLPGFWGWGRNMSNGSEREAAWTTAPRKKQSLHAWDYDWSFSYRIKQQRKLVYKHLSKPFTFLMFPCWSHHMFSIEDYSKDKDRCGPLKNWKTFFSGTAEKLFFTVCMYIFNLKNAMKQTKAELGWTPSSMYKFLSSIQWKD